MSRLLSARTHFVISGAIRLVVFLGLLTAPAGFAYQLMIPFNIPQAPKYINSLGAADYDWMGRFKKGQDLAQQGHPADALSEYVWCFEDGGLISSHSARLNALLTKVIELGRTYPPAVRELQDWQLKASEKVRLNNNDLYNLYMLVGINSALGADAATLKVYDNLPPGLTRLFVGKELFQKLVNNRRYAGAIAAQPPRFVHETLKRIAANPKSVTPEEKSYEIEEGAAMAEALGGVRDGREARALADDVLAVDRSPATIAILKAHLGRIGGGTWLATEVRRLELQKRK